MSKYTFFTDQTTKGHSSLHHRGNIAGAPGCLQIEAAGETVDIEHFTGKIETRTNFAFKGTHIDTL